MGKYKYDSLSPIAPFRILNIGNTKKVFLLDFIKEIEKVLKKKAIRNYMPLQKGDVKKTFADIDYSKRKLNYKPSTSISDGIPKFIEWYKSYHKLS